VFGGLAGAREDELLGGAHAGRLPGVRRAVHAEQGPAERVTVIHGQDEQRLGW
jgi:hypothetical protein